MTSFIDRFKSRRCLTDDELIRPYSDRVKQELLADNLPSAVAFLTVAIDLAPDRLDLVLMRAQIFQYGMNNYSAALKDYRFILSHLEQHPDRALDLKCREGMRDMMAE